MIAQIEKDYKARGVCSTSYIMRKYKLNSLKSQQYLKELSLDCESYDRNEDGVISVIYLVNTNRREKERGPNYKGRDLLKNDV